MIFFNYVLPILMLLSGLASLVVFIYALGILRNLIAAITEIFEDFVTPRGEDQLSHFGEIVATTTKSIGVEVGAAVNHSLQSSLGGTMKGVTAELEAQAVADNPNAAFIQMMPKSIKKSPLASLMMSGAFNNVISKMGGGNPNNNGNNHTAGGQVKFKL